MAITTFATPLDGALFYAARGKRVFPCKGKAGIDDDDAKRPCINGWQDEATTDATKIREFAARFDGCNFAHALGPRDLVIDLDRKNGKDGVAAFSEMEIAYGVLPSTYRVTSPTGGIHIYTQINRKVKQSAGKVAPGIDIRTAGGYVIIPGSGLSTGSYRIENDPGPESVACPEWFLARLDARDRLARPEDSEVLGSIPEGRRDNELTRWAGVLRGQGLTRDEIAAALHVMNNTRLTSPLKEGDIERIASSMGKKERGDAGAMSDFLAADLAVGAPTLQAYNARAIRARTIPAPDQILTNFFDTGDVVGVFGKSKAKKSWFMARLAIAIASGTPFLQWEVPKKRRVLLFQLEVKRDHYETRIQKMIRSIGDELDNLDIIHCRGVQMTAAKIAAEARAREAEIVFIDPIYLLFANGENTAEDIRPVIQEFSKLAEDGIAVVYAMHDAKGRSGDRELVDRGSGSGIIGRAYDTMMGLDPHAEEADAIVIRSICRNYPPCPDLVAYFDDGEFSLAEDLAPNPMTSASEAKKRARGTPLSEVAEQVAGAIPKDGATKGDLMAKIKIGRNRLIEALQFLQTSGRVKMVSEGQNHEKRAFILGSPSFSAILDKTPDFQEIQGLI